MTFNRQAIYDQQLQHLLTMAQRPEWKRYAWARAKELASDESGLFRGIDQALTAAMTGGPGRHGESDPQNPAKHP